MRKKDENYDDVLNYTIEGWGNESHYMDLEKIGNGTYCEVYVNLNV